jgi:endo-1,4-beta-xylanase
LVKNRDAYGGSRIGEVGLMSRMGASLLGGILAVVLLAGCGVVAQGTEAIVVDGYNIAAAVSATPLRDVYRDYFMMGVGLNGSSIQTDTVNSSAMCEIIKVHFNSVTYSNLMKPVYFLDQAGSIRNCNAGNPEPAVRFDSAIRGMEFCRRMGIRMRGHVLVWHTQTPDWFFRTGYRDNGDYVDRETMLARLESYIRQVLEFFQTEYPGVIYAWDVVNEAVENTWGNYETQSGFNIRTRTDGSGANPWYMVVGVDYVEKAFEYARKYADPEVKLFYNDYNTFQPTKTQAIYKLASHLKDKGLIDGIGMQGYMDLSYPGISGGRDSFKAAIEKFAELGLEIHITELSIRTNGSSEELFRKQADRYEEVFRVLTELDTASGGPANITSVTVFGLMDNYLFYTNDTTTTRLFDGKLQPKPAFYSVLKVGEELGGTPDK